MSWLVDKPVVVPFDFSEHSELALKRALSLVEKSDQLHVLHVLPFLIPTEPGLFGPQSMMRIASSTPWKRSRKR